MAYAIIAIEILLLVGMFAWVMAEGRWLKGDDEGKWLMAGVSFGKAAENVLVANGLWKDWFVQMGLEMTLQSGHQARLSMSCISSDINSSSG